jgi:hypothetical protein
MAHSEHVGDQGEIQQKCEPFTQPTVHQPTDDTFSREGCLDWRAPANATGVLRQQEDAWELC